MAATRLAERPHGMPARGRLGMLSDVTAIWLWNWGDGVRYAIEPSTEGGYDSVVEIGLQGSIDREHWDSLGAAKARFHDELAQRADDGVDGAAEALAELDALQAR